MRGTTLATTSRHRESDFTPRPAATRPFPGVDVIRLFEVDGNVESLVSETIVFLFYGTSWIALKRTVDFSDDLPVLSCDTFNYCSR